MLIGNPVRIQPCIALQNVDARRWNELLELFASEVVSDYTSLFGGDSIQQPPEKLVESRASFLPGFTRTQHMIGVPVVSVDESVASLVAPVVAWHVCKNPDPPDGDTWLVGGRYEMQLAKIDGKWRITHLTLASAWEEGNLELPLIARDRATQNSQRSDD
jgi:hypothetical protein